MTTYPLAPRGVFATLQGEGALLGEPMVFVRLAGCPVGCAGCDTDYSVAERVGCDEIVRRVAAAAPPAARWVWLTGGEPTTHDPKPLVAALHKYDYRVALATAGINPVQVGAYHGGVDFVSVSPHRIDDTWVLRRGDQLNVVPTLNGLRLDDLEGVDVSGFSHRFVTPFWYAPAGRAEGVAPHVARVVVIPKVPGRVGEIPDEVGGRPVVLGFSVPTRYGGTTCGTWEFGRRPAHLLGGSPQAQMELAQYLRVVSADGNMAAQQARKGRFWNRRPGPKGHWDQLRTAGDARTTSVPQECFRRSLAAIRATWEDRFG